MSREEFNQRIMELNSLRNELDRTKKDKNITSGLVNQMQRDMTNKVRGPYNDQVLKGFSSHIILGFFI